MMQSKPGAGTDRTPRPIPAGSRPRPGRTLETVFELARHRALGWDRRRALELLLELCEHVAGAHDAGVAHLALSPESVRLGTRGAVEVSGWGRAPDRPGRALPAAYLAPECAAGRWTQVGPASDVYSLGAMLVRVLTGRTPAAAQPGAPAPFALEERMRRVPAPLRAACRRALSRHPGERFGHARELAAELRAWLAGQRLQGQPAMPGMRRARPLPRIAAGGAPVADPPAPALGRS